MTIESINLRAVLRDLDDRFTYLESEREKYKELYKKEANTVSEMLSERISDNIAGLFNAFHLEEKIKSLEKARLIAIYNCATIEEARDLIKELILDSNL